MPADITTPWRTVREIAARWRCGEKLVYREIAAGRLRAARIGGRRDYRILDEWADEALIRMSTPVEIRPAIKRSA
jgi:excisionase family DNA binding protein